MLYSMTGYGKGVSENDDVKITVEMKSVNHRFLDIYSKLPKQFNYLDESIRATLCENNIRRGHFDVFVAMENKGDFGKSARINYELAKFYINALKKISDDSNLDNDVSAHKILLSPGVVELDYEDINDEDLIKEIFLNALKVSIENLVIMRKNEGSRLKFDLETKVDNVKELIDSIVKISDEIYAEQFERSKLRMQTMLKDIPLDNNRVMNELVIFADKVGIDEEITRLLSHIEAFKKELNAELTSGKKLDFITQEINREVNTIGSKCSNYSIAQTVVALKVEIEKIREQIQNIE